MTVNVQPPSMTDPRMTHVRQRVLQDTGRWATLVRRLRYKPGYRLSVRASEVSPVLVVDMVLPDARWTPPEEDRTRVSGRDPLAVLDVPFRQEWDRRRQEYRMVRDTLLPVKELRLETNLPSWFDATEAMQHLHLILSGMEIHELEEWLRLDGELVFDPHRPHAENQAVLSRLLGEPVPERPSLPSLSGVRRDPAGG